MKLSYTLKEEETREIKATVFHMHGSPDELCYNFPLGGDRVMTLYYDGCWVEQRDFPLGSELIKHLYTGDKIVIEL